MRKSAGLCLLVCVYSAVYGSVVSKPRIGNPSDFTVSVSTDGTYSLKIKNVTWLTSAPTFFRADGKSFSAKDRTLVLNLITATYGSDKIGDWQAFNFFYQAGASAIEASIKIYGPQAPFVIFKQKYVNGANNTAADNENKVISSFPGFKVQTVSEELGFLSYGGSMFGDSGKSFGKWGGPETTISDGITGGPLTVFDKKQNVLVISPASKFMSVSNWHEPAASTGGALHWGTMGGVTEVPPGHEMNTIVFYSGEGVNKAFEHWGEVLRYWYGRDDQFVKSDLTVNYLGYWTDNGAYYYYNTEKGKTYEQTLMDVTADIHKSKLPFRYIQYDSWWYYKGTGGGVKTWKSRPDVFPHGMQYLYNKTGFPVSAHNRYWASDTTYAKQNGGKYNFVIDKTKSLPTDQNFWNDLLNEARKWGLVTYEQDWLNVEFAGLNALLTNIELGEQWLKQMGIGAAKNGLTIQYCMSNPRHALQALEIPVVSQARVSDDYHPGKDQWKIGVSSIFAHALRVAPFKDNFWTTTNQPGNPYKRTEPYTELNALVATLSTGPVGPSDMIGALNVTIIMKSVNADGLILKPSKPATAIDDQILKAALPDTTGPDGEVWTTHTDIGGLRFGIVLAADLSNTYSLTPLAAGFGQTPGSQVFSHKQPSKLQSFNESSPLTLSGCTKLDFCLNYVTPPIPSPYQTSWVILGELDKWVPISPQRITDIKLDGDVTVRVTGASNEIVNFWFAVNGKPQEVKCTLGNSGFATVSLKALKCFPE